MTFPVLQSAIWEEGQGRKERNRRKAKEVENEVEEKTWQGNDTDLRREWLKLEVKNETKNLGKKKVGEVDCRKEKLVEIEFCGHICLGKDQYSTY